MKKEKEGAEGTPHPPGRAEEMPQGDIRLLETLLDHTHMLVAYLDPKFNFVRVNRAYAEADERDPSFFPGKNHFDLYPNAENERIFEEVVKTGKPYFAQAKPFEYAEHPERGVSYWDWSLIPTKSPAGAVTGVVLTLVNVTQRRLAEEALWKTHHELEVRVAERTRELSTANIELKEEVAERKGAEEKLRASEEKYKTLVETSRDIIFKVDLNGNFLFVNRAFEKLLGYSAEEAKGLNGFELVHPDDSKAVKQQFTRLVEGESLDNMEYRYKRKDGSYINILNSAVPVFDSEGNVVAGFGVARDITRRKQAEKALQESELWMRNMFNSLEEAVFVVTPERALVDMNQAAQKMFGYSKKELVDLSTEILHVDHEHYLEFGRRIEKAFEEGRAASFEFQAKRKDGEIFPTEHTVALLKNDAGQSLGIVSVVRDVTERRRTEEELSRYREHLEELVGERTAELKRTNERLGREISERKQAEEGLEWELAVNSELTQLSEALIKGWSSIPSIANIVLDSAKSLTQSEHGYVSSIDSETGDHIAHTLTEMMGKQCQVRREDRRIRFAVGADGLYPSLWGYSLNYRKAFFTNSPAEHEASRGAPDGHIRIRNFLSVPAIIGKELVGQIALANSDRAYTDRHLDAIRRLAELYAIAIQRRRAEEALAAEREFTERALSAQTDTFFVFEPSTGRAVRWNKAFREVSGYSDQEIRSMKAPESYYGEDDLRKAAVASERILREGIATVELSLITKDGRSIPTEYTGSAMGDSQGKPKYIIAVGRDISERKRSEEKIRQQNEFLENIIESLTHPFLVIDAHDYTIKAANSAALVDGKPGTLKCYAVSHGRSSPCQGEEHPCPLAELRRTKKPVVVEHIHYDGEGNFRTVEVYGYPIFDRRGDVAQMIEYCLDITERKLAEQALRESEEKFRGLAEQSPNMIFINRKGRVVYANRRCEEIMGYRRAEFYSPEFDFLEMVAPECRDLVKENFGKHGRGEEVHPYEYTLRTKDGKKIEAILNSRLITYAGEPAILGIVTDITERKRVEQELRRRSYDLGERIKELNCLYLISNLLEKPGISLEEILQGTADLIPAAWEYPDITCARVILEDKVFLTSNFKETIWNQSTEIVVHGEPVGSVEVGYLEDRPEKDEGPFLAEERNLLKAIAERLGRVVERTRASEEIRKLNASLKAQAQELAAANKELEAFSYSASHDLRAPLRTIDGFSQALLEDYADSMDQSGKDYLQRLRSAAQRMGQLIDDLLNLSLTIRMEMYREETNLSELARTIKGELQQAKPERRVDFAIQDQVWAEGDARLLRELLANLLGNAWKFTGNTPDARIEFGVETQGDRTVYFVRDNGAGFDMNYADKLFVPFQRLHSDSEFPGNGIGLALVSRIVNRHGGRIWAEGEMEKGATFYFTLQ